MVPGTNSILPNRSVVFSRETVKTRFPKLSFAIGTSKHFFFSQTSNETKDPEIVSWRVYKKVIFQIMFFLTSVNKESQIEWKMEKKQGKAGHCQQ